jgi:hypothetical protein
MIMLVGMPTDGPLAAVRNALHRLGYPVFFFDQRDVLSTEVELWVGMDIEGTMRVGNQTITLDKVTAVYLRCYDFCRTPATEQAGPESPAWQHALDIEDALLSWVDLTPALVVNRPSAMASNSSKPYQSSIIRLFGFEVPDTLITTDPGAVQEFWETHGSVIYESISSVRSIVSRLSPAHVNRMRDVSWCPTQFQQYISGQEYRVHVVGGEVFACQVISTADDYRYATRYGATAEICPYTLPDECADRCRALAAAMGLTVAGIDLRCTPSRQWYCFEVNPSPAFTYYQAVTHQPIAETIARLLGKPPGFSCPAQSQLEGLTAR